jgi:hypothetical protein
MVYQRNNQGMRLGNLGGAGRGRRALQIHLSEVA